MARMNSRAFFFLASLSEAVLPFVRNLLLARILSPSDFGTAILIATIWSLFEVCTDLGVAQYAVRYPDGRPSGTVLATLHTIQLLRACLVAVLVAIAAPLVAFSIAIPELKKAVWVVAAAVAVKGFVHLHAYLAAREGNFTPQAWMLLSGQLAWTFVAVVGAVVLGSPTAMAFGMAAAFIASTVVSHLASRGAWQLGWDQNAVREALHFGAPLVPNGIVSAVLYMGDRLLVAWLLGVEAVALYVVLMTSAFLPSGVILRYLASVFLPLFASVERRSAASAELDLGWISILAGFGFLYAIGVMLVVLPLVPLVFGRDYVVDPALLPLLGIAAYARCFHAMAIPKRMSHGDTAYALRVNASLAPAVLLGAGGAIFGDSLFWFIVGLVVGETLVATVIVVRASAIFEVSGRHILQLFVPSTVALVALAIAIAFLDGGFALYTFAASATLIGIIGVAASVRPAASKILRKAVAA